MKLKDMQKSIHKDVYDVLDKEGIVDFRKSQEKAFGKGLLEGKNLLVCTPTASGKTLIGELAFTKCIIQGRGKAIYLVPLKALASEKYKSFKNRYGHLFRVALSIGETDSSDSYLENYDLIVCTSEKLDALIRHNTPWLKYVKAVVVDEIHLLNDPGRGPTLEILLTILREMIKDVQVIGLSATIGNPEELAKWLDAELVKDRWRPVELHKGVYLDGKVTFEKQR